GLDRAAAHRDLVRRAASGRLVAATGPGGRRSASGGPAAGGSGRRRPPSMVGGPGQPETAWPASRALTSMTDGFVAAVPSGNTTVGTTRLPLFTLITNSAASGF